MRTFRLEDPLHPNGGFLINVKCDRDCVFCKHCTDIFWDYTNLIYMIFCELNIDAWEGNEKGEHTCEHFEEGGEQCLSENVTYADQK